MPPATRRTTSSERSGRAGTRPRSTRSRQAPVEEAPAPPEATAPAQTPAPATATEGPTTPATPAAEAPAVEAPPAEARPAEARSRASHRPSSTPGEPPTLSLRLPFLSVSITRPVEHEEQHRGPAGSPPAPASPRAGAEGSAEVPRLLFYGGMAALGIAGVVEWPVAAAIAAGTWLAGRTRSRAGRPAGSGK